jgi:hypothetical protein
MSLRRIIQTAAVTLVVAFALGVPAAVTSTGPVAHAAAPSSITNGVRQAKPDGAATDLTVLIKRVVNILLFVVGAAAVILIIIGGIRYVTSAGDQNQITGAKNTILYAVVGLVVAAAAYAIVNFVVTKI